MSSSPESYCIANQDGTLKATLINIGASLTHLFIKAKDGIERDIVLGLPQPKDYIDHNESYFGCVVGRVAGRIKDATLMIDGTRYFVDKNDGLNSLHGGKLGFSRRQWSVVNKTSDSVKFKLLSKHGESGYPGTVEVFVEYLVTKANELALKYQAKLLDGQGEENVDATVVNLTNHSYFNLSGFQGKTDHTIHNHVVQMNCQDYLEKGDDLTPTGRILSVDKCEAMNFLTPKKIGSHIGLVGGYDDYYLISGSKDRIKGESILSEAVQVYCSSSGIKMKMFTTEPGFQFYTGNFLHPGIPCKSYAGENGLKYDKHYGFCLEAQRHPNAINVDDWQSCVILRRGQTYKQTTLYSFENC